MDKIIKKTNVSFGDNNEEWKEPDDNVIMENSAIYHTGSKSGEDLKREEGGLLQKAIAFFFGGNQASNVVPDSTSHIDSPPPPAHIMSRSEERKDQPQLREEDLPALNTHSKTNDKPSEEGSTKKKERKEIVKDKAKAFITGPPIVTPDSTSRVDSQFSEGDRVVVQTMKEKAIFGTVQWVGPVKTSRETGGIVVPVVGIETVS